MLEGPAAITELPVPFVAPGEEEAYLGAAGVEGEGESYLEAMRRLKGSLGFGEAWGQGATVADKWQAIINQIGTLEATNVEAVQLFSSLRYDHDRGWYQVDVDLIQHPEYT